MGFFFNRKNGIHDAVFDWDAYREDIARNISVDEQERKFKNLDYYISKSEFAYRNIPVADYAK